MGSLRLYKPRVTRDARASLLVLFPGLVASGCGERTRLELGESRPWDLAGSNSSPASGVPSAAASSSDERTDEATTDATREMLPAAGVRGRVVDFWGQAVPHVALDVDGQVVRADVDGVFEVNEARKIYDVSLVVHIEGEARETYAWTFEGLTRRDPLLQVYRGLPPRRATLRFTRLGAADRTPPCAALAISGEHGHDAFAFNEDARISFVWRGPRVLDASAEVLFWEPPSTGDCGAVEAYLFPDSRVLRIQPGGVYDVEVRDPVAAQTMATSTITGRVVAAEPVTMSLFAQTSGGSSVPIPSSPVVNGGYTQEVPLVEDATFVVAASRGGFGAVDYAVSYVMGVQPGTSDVDLALPSVSSLTSPPADARVARGESFEWEPTGVVSLFSVSEEQAFVTQYVVTRRSEVTLRDLSHLGATWNHGAEHRWAVERHGAVASLDEWSSGFSLDPFSVDFAVPVGPHRKASHFARSALRSVRFDSP